LNVLGGAPKDERAFRASATHALSDIATITELGFANSDYEFWCVRPGRHPRALVGRMNAEVLKALDRPSVRERLMSIGGSPTPMTTSGSSGKSARTPALCRRLDFNQTEGRI
jgi:hypothetical protein